MAVCHNAAYDFPCGFMFLNNVVFTLDPPSSRGGSHVIDTESLVISVTFRLTGGLGVSRTLTVTKADFVPLFSNVRVYFPLSYRLTLSRTSGGEAASAVDYSCV